ncbi:MAG TPA: hypothetical protein DHW02_07060 [Ktedonobacter sp.]|nr:hypothetical protein [Ktedonobacter sp.]
MEDNFFSYQQRRIWILLVWGLVSVISGLILQISRSSFWKQFGLQAVAWGAIDAALAAFGLTSANRKEERLALGKLHEVDVQKEVRGFFRILFINTFLDIVYVASGVWVMRRFKDRADRRGVGVGILVQGLWLFLFDGLMSQEGRLRWKGK